MHVSVIPIVIFVNVLFLGQKLQGMADSVGGFEFGNTQVELNLYDSTYPIEILEYSNGLLNGNLFLEIMEKDGNRFFHPLTR